MICDRILNITSITIILIGFICLVLWGIRVWDQTSALENNLKAIEFNSKSLENIDKKIDILIKNPK